MVNIVVGLFWIVVLLEGAVVVFTVGTIVSDKLSICRDNTFKANTMKVIIGFSVVSFIAIVAYLLGDVINTYASNHIRR